MMRDDLLLYHLFVSPKHMPRTVQLRICSTSRALPYLLIRVFIANGPHRSSLRVVERDQEEEKHDRMTGSRSGSNSNISNSDSREAGPPDKGTMHIGPSFNDAWKHVQQAHTKAHVLARGVRAYRTRSQDLLRVGQRQVGTTGRKREPRNFPFGKIKINVSRCVGDARRGERKQGERTCRILFFA